MKAIYLREVSEYFKGIAAYVFIAVMLLFTGIYTLALNINAGSSQFEFVIQSMSYIFVTLVPLLTMKVISEEKQQRTDRLLYSLPVSMTGVVLGKFFAILTVFAVPILIISTYPLILHQFGDLFFPRAYSAICGLFLMGAALFSVGIYISSITESQAIAGVVTFMALLANYFLSSITQYLPANALFSLLAFSALTIGFGFVVYYMTKHAAFSAILTVVLEALLIGAFFIKPSMFEGAITTALNSISIFDKLTLFVTGILSLSAIVFFVSVVVVFLFLSIQTLEKRRWS